jgi:hypothetical protein
MCWLELRLESPERLSLHGLWWVQLWVVGLGRRLWRSGLWSPGLGVWRPAGFLGGGGSFGRGITVVVRDGFLALPGEFFRSFVTKKPHFSQRTREMGHPAPGNRFRLRARLWSAAARDGKNWAVAVC